MVERSIHIGKVSGSIPLVATMKIGNFILEFIQSIVLALSVFVLLYLFVAQPNQVKGSSMVPNFTDGEYLLTDKVSYEIGKPQHGDVVVFKAPPSEPCSADECEYIKRVIGLPGDRVMVKNNKVYLNGAELNQFWLPADFVTVPGAFAQEGVEVIVPPDQYLCFGDNRSYSRDGREFGTIKRSSIVGKAFFKYWPITAVGLIPTVRF